MKELIDFATAHPWWTLVYIVVIGQLAVYLAAAIRSGKSNDL